VLRMIEDTKKYKLIANIPENNEMQKNSITL
jgi:hypothetical protein